MPHEEERTFAIHLHLSASFSDEYEGDEDGYAWFKQFEQGLRQRLIAALVDAVRADGRWEALPAPRGRDPSHGLDLEVRYRPRQ